MFAKIHRGGHSFSGVCRYLLHDPDRATTSDRVNWVETRNLATDDPQLAWRIMAATAMNQGVLKEAAGLRKTGRKAGGSVYHLTLSWEPDEVEGLSREQMLAAADEAITQLGRKATKAAPDQFGNEHQALLISHTDTDHPHVHIVLNRVHPVHGRMLVDSHSQKQLSKWALKYEQENGKIVCEQRLENNAARDRGETVHAKKDQPRHLYELEKKNQRSDADRIRREQRAKDRQLCEQVRESKQSHQAAWKQLHDGFRSGKETLAHQGRQLAHRAAASVREDYQTYWKKLYAKQRSDLIVFARREQKLLGRIQNALASIDWRSLAERKDRVAAVREVFSQIGSGDARLGALQKAHQTEARRLQARENAAAREASQQVQRRIKKDISRQRIQFLNRREELLAKRDRSQKAIEVAWVRRTEDRTKAWHSQVAQRDFNAAAKGADPRKKSERTKATRRDLNPHRRKRPEQEHDRGR